MIAVPVAAMPSSVSLADVLMNLFTAYRVVRRSLAGRIGKGGVYRRYVSSDGVVDYYALDFISGTPNLVVGLIRPRLFSY